MNYLGSSWVFWGQPNCPWRSSTRRWAGALSVGVSKQLETEAGSGAVDALRGCTSWEPQREMTRKDGWFPKDSKSLKLLDTFKIDLEKNKRINSNLQLDRAFAAGHVAELFGGPDCGVVEVEVVKAEKFHVKMS